MIVEPTVKDAYDLMHRGALALALVEKNGMRIDVERMDNSIKSTRDKIEGNERFLQDSREWKVWKKRYGSSASLGSRAQLGVVLYEDMGYEVGSKTKTGRAQVNEEQLAKLNSDFVTAYLENEKLKKLLSTYLIGIRREVCNGYLHPSFNLHMVRTYRSSSSTPNFQNIPIRDPKIGSLIRSCFVPRKNHILVEIDYGALEFRIASCFWQDMAMVDYACNPELDIHRDIAMECYCLTKDEVTKKARFHAKNQFVFPTLYNSYYVNTARHLWASIKDDKLETSQGVPLDRHLADKGITRQTFEDHIKGVEQNFNNRFSTWSKKKERWWKDYLMDGEFNLMTGFRVKGVMNRNQIANIPIQGPAFHILLWSLTRLVKWMVKSKMKSKIIGQIHDSIVADVHKNELQDYLEKAKQVMTEDVRKYWPWIITDLMIEVETSSTNWYEKKELAI